MNKFDVVVYAFKSYFCNEIVCRIPSHKIRLFLYRKFLGVRIGKDSSIGLHSVLIHPTGITVGDNCAIGQYVYLDGRGGLKIGNNVNISTRTTIFTGTHNQNSPMWEYQTKLTTIDDHSWIAGCSVLLPGVNIGKGAVVASGSVVVKDVMPFEVVGGNPAKKISQRIKQIDYLTCYFPYFY